jgi:hypothetical protein
MDLPLATAATRRAAPPPQISIDRFESVTFDANDKGAAVSEVATSPVIAVGLLL